MTLPSNTVERPRLFICGWLSSEALAADLAQHLPYDRYTTTFLHNLEQTFAWIEQKKHETDCLVLEDNPDLPVLVRQLHQAAILLPAVILTSKPLNSLDPSTAVSVEASPDLVEPLPEPQNHSQTHYHVAEVKFSLEKINQISAPVDQAIARFLRLTTAYHLPVPEPVTPETAELAVHNFLTLQQRRLSEKLKERLDYVGIYYKRDPKSFLRHMPSAEKQQFIDELRSDYQDIVLNYFRLEGVINQKIDALVNKAFFADVSASQILEIHMKLIDDFARQLKLEGRSEEILLDYRLTLIDTIAHLCEMYRRSMYREP